MSKGGGTDNQARECSKVIEPRIVTVNAAPPNKWMELTVLLGSSSLASGDTETMSQAERSEE